MADKRRTLKVMPTEYMLGLLVKDRERQMDCDHLNFYMDADQTVRCDYCNKIVDPDEIEWGNEVSNTLVEDPDNE